MSIEVEPQVFSGRPNPTFELDDAETADLVGRVAIVVAGAGEPPTDEIGPLGYSGFRVTMADGDGLPGDLYVFQGRVTVTTPVSSTAFQDVTGVEAFLIAAGRSHGQSELFDGLNIA
jgi:hypothetical protein